MYKEKNHKKKNKDPDPFPYLLSDMKSSFIIEVPVFWRFFRLSFSNKAIQKDRKPVKSFVLK